MYEFQDLTNLFNPRAIALVGASDRARSIGAFTLENLTTYSDFDGELFLINPKKDAIGERKCYPSIAALPAVPDVALIVIPAAGVVAAIEDAAAKGVPFAIVLTSGFSEADDWGRAEERKIQEIVARTGIRVYGPNCPGLVNINRRLGMSFSPAYKDDLRRGPIGLATQGGGLGRMMLQSLERGVGFALWSSSGNECDLQVADFIHHMADAPDVKVIGTLIEGIKDGPRFAAAVAHAARRGKPVVGLKVGRSEYGAKAAQSHTASITGSAEVNSAVLRQFGVIEVDDLDELIDVAQLLARRLPTGEEKIGVFASSGGAASLCADNVGTAGLTLAEFAPETTARLAEVLPSYAAIGNPVDTTAMSLTNPQAYEDSLLPVAEDPNVGIVLIPLAMDYGAITEATSKMIVNVQKKTETPICPIWMSDRLGLGFQVLNEAALPPFKSLRNMAKAVRRWVDWGAWRAQADLDWTPLLERTGALAEPGATRTLSEIDGKAALAAAGVPTTVPKLAASAAEAGAIAQEIGRPVAMKIVSPEITHKSDVGGVRLGVPGAAAAEAFEAIMASVRGAKPEARLDGVLIEPMAPEGGAEAFVGVSRDPVFGHVMTVGLGGIYVELFKDVTRRMLPVTDAMARAMIGELKSAPLLTGMRGRPPRDIDALARLIVAVSDFVAAHAERIEELDINPVWVGEAGEGVLALDAVIVERA